MMPRMAPPSPPPTPETIARRVVLKRADGLWEIQGVWLGTPPSYLRTIPAYVLQKFSERAAYYVQQEAPAHAN